MGSVSLVAIAQIVLALTALAVGGLIWFIVHRSRGGTKGTPNTAAVPPIRDPQARLAQLNTLLAGGHITQEEFERQRAAVISAV